MIFISPKPGSAEIRLREVGGVGRLAPEPRRVAAVLLLDERARSCTRLAIEPGKRCTAGVSRKAASTSAGSRSRDLERSEPLLDLERPGERGLHRHLLVEREPDQQCERVGGEQLVRLVVAVK